MTIFYDFDGTLTKNAFPVYPIIEICDVPLNEFYKKVLQEQDIYLALCRVFSNILKSHNYQINADNIVLTSGFQEFVKSTPISKYFKSIIGTELDHEGNPSFIVSDETKSEIIKKYIKNNNLSGEDIVYIGDGFTDRFAFEYVTSIGGTSILVYDSKNEKDNQVRNEFIESNIITASFTKDFSKESELFTYINSLICKEGK